MKKTLIFVAPLFLAAILWGAWSLFRPEQPQPPPFPGMAPMMPVKQIVKEQDELGWIKAADNWRFRELEEKIVKKRHLSDSDVEWLLELRAKPSTNAPWVRHLVMDLFSRTPVLTASQQSVLRELAVNELGSAEDLDREGAIRVLWRLADPTTVPALLPMLNDPDDLVRKRARWALDRMGYSADQNQPAGSGTGA
ncbi:MAG: HEAT repeat domain-containing protein [Bacillota bacterium]